MAVAEGHECVVPVIEIYGDVENRAFATGLNIFHSNRAGDIGLDGWTHVQRDAKPGETNLWFLGAFISQTYLNFDYGFLTVKNLSDDRRTVTR